MGALLVRLLGVALMFSALAIPLMRAPDRPVQTLVARWAPAPSDFLDLGGQLVHYRDEGPRDDPLPLVLVHGTSASLHTWEGWTRALRGQRRVISLDLPGFGLTGPYTGRYAGRPYGGDEDARFVLDLLDALKLRRFAIGGNSLGGEVAWRVATLAPERVDRLLLVDAAGYAFESESVPLGFLIARTPVVNTLFEHLLPRAVIVASLRNVYGDPARISDALVDRYYELTLRAGNRHALGERAAQRRPGADIERLRALKVPTLILWGGRDRLIPPAVGQRFAADIAGSRLQLFPALGHVPQEEDPAATVGPVREFLGLKP